MKKRSHAGAFWFTEKPLIVKMQILAISGFLYVSVFIIMSAE